MSRRTSCKIVINVTNEEAKKDSILSNTNSLNFADIQNVKNKG